MKRNQITMIKCPYCDKEYIDEDAQVVCDTCEPGVNADMLVANIYSEVQDLAKLPPSAIGIRIDILEMIIDKLNTIVSNTQTKDK